MIKYQRRRYAKISGEGISPLLNVHDGLIIFANHQTRHEKCGRKYGERCRHPGTRGEENRKAWQRARATATRGMRGAASLRACCAAHYARCAPRAKRKSRWRRWQLFCARQLPCAAKSDTLHGKAKSKGGVKGEREERRHRRRKKGGRQGVAGPSGVFRKSRQRENVISAHQNICALRAQRAIKHKGKHRTRMKIAENQSLRAAHGALLNISNGRSAWHLKRRKHQASARRGAAYATARMHGRRRGREGKKTRRRLLREMEDKISARRWRLRAVCQSIVMKQQERAEWWIKQEKYQHARKRRKAASAHSSVIILIFWRETCLHGCMAEEMQ